jgi:SAM-dependent methyltransferase
MSSIVDPRVNTNVDYYLDQDPETFFYPPILDFLQGRVGRKILDLGCGIGVYSSRLQQLGFEVTAVDRNPRYVERARAAGVNAQQAHGEELPFADASFDTVFLVEVLEHIPEPVVAPFLAEARRVTRRNVLFTVPNCTQFPHLIDEGLMHGHFIAVDHVQFFTVESLSTLLRQFFSRVNVREGDPLYPHRLLPAVVRWPLSLLYRLGWLRPTIYSRLYAEATKDT